MKRVGWKFLPIECIRSLPNLNSINVLRGILDNQHSNSEKYGTNHNDGEYTGCFDGFHFWFTTIDCVEYCFMLNIK